MRCSGRSAAIRARTRPSNDGTPAAVWPISVSLSQRLADQHDLRDLLPGERQPGHDGRGEVRLGVQVVRHVQQRARRRHGERADRPEQRRGLRERGGEVRAPHVAAVHDPGDHRLVPQPRQIRDPVRRGGRGDQVDRDGLDRGLREHRQCLAEVAEVARDQDRGPVGRLAEAGVRAAQRGQFGLGAVRRERGLVELHPLRARVGQRRQQFDVPVDQPVQQVQRREALGRARRGLGQQQERHRADEHRPGRDTEGERLAELGDGLVPDQREPGRRVQFRHQVVVVGVEPLGQLQRRHAVPPAGRGEVGVQPGQSEVAEPPGHGVEQHGRVEHVVVVGERVAGHGVQARGGQLPPRVRAQFAGYRGQDVRVGAARPVRLHRALQLAARSDPGEAQHGRPDFGGVHSSLLASVPTRPGRRGGTREGAARGATRVRADLPTRSRTPRAPVVRVPVAGLRTRGHPPEDRWTYWPSLPRPLGPSALMTAVVPAHRCGAVPDSHRVPSCLAAPRGARRTTSGPSLAESRHVVGGRPDGGSRVVANAMTRAGACESAVPGVRATTDPRFPGRRRSAVVYSGEDHVHEEGVRP